MQIMQRRQREQVKITTTHTTKTREQLQDGPADCYLAALCLDPHYVRSAILHNPLSLKIKPRRISELGSASDEDVLKSPTYQRVTKYLKVVLEAEFKSQHNPVLKGKTATFVRESFVRQFERYVKGQYPFDTPLEEGQNTLSYWIHLTKISEGSVLACMAQKLYSIKASSIPEERTMSVFTKMNTPARNRQQVRTLVDMTQIRQWHMYDPEKIAERRRPDVAFCDIESLISAPTKSPVDRTEKHGSTGSYSSVDTADGEEEVLDEEYTWLDEVVASVQAQDSAFDVEAEVDIHAPIVTRILSDERESVPDQDLENDGRSTDGTSDLEDADAEWANW
ncbi:hypothetical protein DFJ58DRAFT_848325 [Suillus subalutaceus]|uniref:uncharacterized protein n=1 Tax=Suillus subalutaceus TaxID=48586 RepID=UPI001B86F9A9|nr:uncharacterized protein DFJ58DRAFT_848325 [Suillus subalutaceus]KAG1830992.1 hypothetical protein DFJ58DRAFT_848325 [Suillus subalutaceus]